jgi:hypothetical protein
VQQRAHRSTSTHVATERGGTGWSCTAAAGG